MDKIELEEKFRKAIKSQSIKFFDRNGNVLDDINDGYVPEAATFPEREDKAKIIFSKEMTKDFEKLKQDVIEINGTGKLEELSYVMLGVRDKNGDFVVCDISFIENSGTASVQENSVDVDKSLSLAVDLYAKTKKQILILFGHSHPAKYKQEDEYKFANTWSGGDLWSGWFYRDYVKIPQSILEVGEMLITPSLDIDTYSIVDGKYCKFSGVYTTKENGELELENSYTSIDKAPVILAKENTLLK